VKFYSLLETHDAEKLRFSKRTTVFPNIRFDIEVLLISQPLIEHWLALIEGGCEKNGINPYEQKISEEKCIQPDGYYSRYVDSLNTH
jgi:hypothetical protein